MAGPNSGVCVMADIIGWRLRPPCSGPVRAFRDIQARRLRHLGLRFRAGAVVDPDRDTGADDEVNPSTIRKVQGY